MTEYLPGMENERRKVELSQWYTPPALAKRIAEFACQAYVGLSPRMLHVLEPSCGRGALIDAMLATERVNFLQAVDIDPDNAVMCRERYGCVTHVFTDCEDFLEWNQGTNYDLAVMNPPFEDGATEAHVMHALKFAERVVCHCPLTTLAGVERGESLWPNVQLHRLAICSSRPKYGTKGGMTDMCTIDVSRKEGWHGQTQVEWWP